MRQLFFAYTQYHLLNIITIRNERSVECNADLIAVNPDVSGATDVIKRLENTKLFDRILILHNNRQEKKGIARYIEHTKCVLRMYKNSAAISDFLKSFEYDEYYSYGSSMESYFALDFIRKKTM